MIIDTLSVESNILKTLENDPVLSSYVKSFTAGTMGHSRFVFPYVDLVNLGCREKQLMAASGELTISFEIFAGVKNIATGVAYKGSETTGFKGIAELCQDIVNVVANNRFNGAFWKPVTNVSANPRFLHDKAETVFAGIVKFTGDVRFMHR